MLTAAAKVEITVLMDNITDVLLDSTDVAVRPPIHSDGEWTVPLVAEHGFSAVVDVYGDSGSRSRVLFDAGTSETGILHNLDRLSLDANSIERVVLSHGHEDHFMGLVPLLKKFDKNREVILHPDAFLRRYLIFPDGTKVRFPYLKEDQLRQNGAEIRKRKEASVIDDRMLVTGEIPRITEFEKGFPIHYAEIDGELKPDPLIRDDQALIFSLKDKGLVVLTGCGHAGIINTIRYSQKLTGIGKIHAVLGGFHLSGSLFERIINPTIRELKEFHPDYVVPSHCTGWRSTHKIAADMPDAFIQNSVGTKFVFQ